MPTETKRIFKEQLQNFAHELSHHISTEDGQWSIKGFIDVLQNVYTISSDTKIVSKILEIHLFPKVLEFANTYGYNVVLAEHQNHYPDISLVKRDDETIKFAVDFKTTYRKPDSPHLCNSFTLGSHGEYFTIPTSTKNITFPYSSYSGHFCLCIIYDRGDNTTIDETQMYSISDLRSITSVISNIEFCAVEKWEIASDIGGSGNTANIGSITHIEDIKNGAGMFSSLGEQWFNDYWRNYKKIIITSSDGQTKQISSLKEFVEYRHGDTSLIVPKRTR